MPEPAPGFEPEPTLPVAPTIQWTTDRALIVRNLAGGDLRSPLPFMLGRSVSELQGFPPTVIQIHERALAGERVSCIVECQDLWFAITAGPVRASDGQVMGVSGAGLVMEGPVPAEGTLLEVTAPIPEWGGEPGDYVMVTGAGPILLRPVSSLSRPLDAALSPISDDRRTRPLPGEVRPGPLRVVR